jgi:Domain of unknown function (DUF4389)
MDDRYPSTDEEQAVHLVYPYPEATELSRGLPLIKWLLAIPHFIVLILLAIVLSFVILIAFFAILFTKKFPESLFNFTVGVTRWGMRVNAYIYLMRDEYPPFSLDA